jgi:hypothetical protein
MAFISSRALHPRYEVQFSFVTRENTASGARERIGTYNSAKP